MAGVAPRPWEEEAAVAEEETRHGDRRGSELVACGRREGKRKGKKITSNTKQLLVRGKRNPEAGLVGLFRSSVPSGAAEQK